MFKRNAIEKLRSTSGQVESLNHDVAAQTDAFKLKNSSLQATSNPAMLKLPQYIHCLNKVKDTLTKVASEIDIEVIRINDEISSYECKINDDSEQLRIISTRYQHCMETIAFLRERIRECLKDERVASLYAEYNRKVSKRSKKAAMIGKIGAGVSIFAFTAGALLLVPVTSGLSLLLFAGFVPILKPNISFAMNTARTASDCTDLAKSHELAAIELREEIQKQQEKCRLEENEMETLRSKIGSLKRRKEELIYVRNVAYEMQNYISDVSIRLQEAADVLFDVTKETEALELVQKLLAKHPDCTSANDYLCDLQKKWDDVLSLLHQVKVSVAQICEQ